MNDGKSATSRGIENLFRDLLDSVKNSGSPTSVTPIRALAIIDELGKAIARAFGFIENKIEGVILNNLDRFGAMNAKIEDVLHKHEDAVFRLQNLFAQFANHESAQQIVHHKIGEDFANLEDRQSATIRELESLRQRVDALPLRNGASAPQVRLHGIRELIDVAIAVEAATRPGFSDTAQQITSALFPVLSALTDELETQARASHADFLDSRSRDNDLASKVGDLEKQLADLRSRLDGNDKRNGAATLTVHVDATEAKKVLGELTEDLLSLSDRDFLRDLRTAKFGAGDDIAIRGYRMRVVALSPETLRLRSKNRQQKETELKESLRRAMARHIHSIESSLPTCGELATDSWRESVHEIALDFQRNAKAMNLSPACVEAIRSLVSITATRAALLHNGSRLAVELCEEVIEGLRELWRN